MYIGLPVCLAVCLSLCCISKYSICVQRSKIGFREELKISGSYDWRGQRLRFQSRMIVYLTSPIPHHKHIKNKSALTIITKYQIKAGTTKSFKEDPQCNQVEWKEKKKNQDGPAPLGGSFERGKVPSFWEPLSLPGRSLDRQGAGVAWTLLETSARVLACWQTG